MPVDYFDKYFTEDAFDMPRLLNDDFIGPVRLLFNAKHYVSASKLLLIAIDSISYVEYGDVRENTFIKWLETYSDLSKVGITPEELWEHRNALLHMSSLESRKVAAGKVRTLVSYVGYLHPDVDLDATDTGYYDLYALIRAFGSACTAWCMSYSEDRSKFEQFVSRYDLIASDARMLDIEYKQ